MKIIRFESVGVFALLFVLIVATAQGEQNRGTIDPDLERTANDCASGKSTLTKQQCTFSVQFVDAMRRVNQLIASGEYGKLPKNTQDTMLALVDTLQTALPLMKERR